MYLGYGLLIFLNKLFKFLSLSFICLMYTDQNILKLYIIIITLKVNVVRLKIGKHKNVVLDLIILRCKPIANFVSLVGFTFLFARRTDKVCMANWCTISRSHTGTYFLRYVKKCVPRV